MNICLERGVLFDMCVVLFDTFRRLIRASPAGGQLQGAHHKTTLMCKLAMGKYPQRKISHAVSSIGWFCINVFFPEIMCVTRYSSVQFIPGKSAGSLTNSR